MTKNNTKKIKKYIRKKTLKNKKGGNPQPNNLSKKLNKIIRDEFPYSFVMAGDIGYSPTAPLEQAKRTLLLRESQKDKGTVEKKSKVTGFETAKASGDTLASAVSKGYSEGIAAGSTVQSRMRQFSSGIESATGVKIPTSFSNLKKSTSNLFPDTPKNPRQTRKSNTRRGSTRSDPLLQTRTGRLTTLGPLNISGLGSTFTTKKQPTQKNITLAPVNLENKKINFNDDKSEKILEKLKKIIPNEILIIEDEVAQKNKIKEIKRTMKNIIEELEEMEPEATKKRGKKTTKREKKEEQTIKTTSKKNSTRN